MNQLVGGAKQPRLDERFRVVARHRAVGPVGVEGAAERIATRARDDVDDRRSDFDFAHVAEARNHQLARLDHVRPILRGARGARSHAHAIDLQTAGLGAGRALRSVCGEPGVHRRHEQRRHVGGRPRDGHVGHDGVLDHLRLARALHVDDRALAADDDRLVERAYLQFHVERRRHRAREDNAVTSNRVEPRQRERHGVGSGLELDDAVGAACVGHRRARPLDQRRARNLDGHARQYCAGGVGHNAGEGWPNRLRRRPRRHQHHAQHEGTEPRVSQPPGDDAHHLCLPGRMRVDEPYWSSPLACRFGTCPTGIVATTVMALVSIRRRWRFCLPRRYGGGRSLAGGIDHGDRAGGDRAADHVPAVRRHVDVVHCAVHRDARSIGDRLGVSHVDRSDGPGDARAARPRVRRDAEIVEDLGVLQHKRVPRVEYGHEAGVRLQQTSLVVLQPYSRRATHDH